MHVHGHGQCGNCGTNVDPCCSGTTADQDPGAQGSAWQIAPELLDRVFASLGGRDRTVTLQALRAALAQALDGTLEAADELIEVARRTGALTTTNATARRSQP